MYQIIINKRTIHFFETGAVVFINLHPSGKQYLAGFVLGNTVNFIITKPAVGSIGLKVIFLAIGAKCA